MNFKKAFTLLMVLIVSFIYVKYRLNTITPPIKNSSKIKVKKNFVDPNKSDAKGNPHFFSASSRNEAKHFVEKLNADPYLTNGNGENILHFLIKKIQNSDDGLEQVLQYYLRFGISPLLTDSRGLSAARLMKRKLCKGVKYPWQSETIKLVEKPEDILLAEDDYKFDHTFRNPVIGVSVVGDSEYKPNWSKGYEFKPCRKHKNGNELYISFSGVIKNAGLSLRLSPDYDFDSLKKIGDNWSCFNSSTGNEEILHSPRVKLNSDLDGLQVDQNKEYETRADGKNLQPSGEIILSCEVIMPRIIEVAFTYNADDFHYDSIKMHYGKWVGLKK